ncbi:MAG TPA: recombinase RecT [Lachnospiraceae bacterium]|nr:recombinase RecT [Lachnospiraceae bacterium]
MAGKIQARVNQTPENAGGAKSVTAMMNSILDSEGYRRRFDELLGKRAPQFISSMITMVNGTPQLQEAFCNAPVTVIQSALKAATFDLPIDPGLGFAYVVPFRNKGKMEAQFILGYKGMIQLALRTGAYKTINVVDVREGELKKFNRLTEEIEIDFIEDEEKREQLPIVGWCGYFKLTNGTEKTVYMTKKQIEAHERKHRKGNYQGFGWRDNFDAMAAKTVLRRLLGKWGLLSIDYQHASPATVAAADAIATGRFDDESEETPEQPKVIDVDPETGEIKETVDG